MTAAARPEDPDPARAGDRPRVAVSISVVLPVLNGAQTLPWCLAALEASSFRDFEIVGVDDGSTDATAQLLADAGVNIVLHNPEPAGCFAARNQGAAAARGNVLLFLDADVEVAPDTLAKVWARFRDSNVEALIGLYALEHPHPNAASRYKNAWIRWSYLNHGNEVDWFFTAIGAVRRETWKRVGGFAETFNRTTGGGDLDFGRRLREAGVAVHLDKTLAVVHRRRFTVWSLLVNDFQRARGWAALGLSRVGVAGSARGGLANVSTGFVAALAQAGALLLFSALSLQQTRVLPLVAIVAATYLATGRAFPLWVARNLSAGFAVRCVALQFVDHLACGFGVLAALLTQWRTEARDITIIR
jgi:glycosyltransferase involved in cell wall biosynthesis